VNDHDQAVLDSALGAPDPLDSEPLLVKRALRRAWESANDAAEAASEGQIGVARDLLDEARRHLDTAEQRRAEAGGRGGAHAGGGRLAMAGLITWNDTPSGSYGALGPFSFIVSRVYGSDGDWMLVAHLPGMENRRARGDLGEVKAIAETWLREFASSFGALFAADLRSELDRLARQQQDLADAKAASGDQQAILESWEHRGRAAAFDHVAELLKAGEAQR
jgi:hypothetical protein